MNVLEVTAEGELWVGTRRGLARYAPREGEGPQFVGYTTEEGLSDSGIISLGEDGAGNVWVGTESGGAMKIARSGILSYGVSDGLNQRA